ncbi:type IV secretion system DNA-binding domain-containing protein [Acetobacter senegalensis]|uniref:type IV secretion system DNA-binding domain-containing protein n=1 Tax=Acetobacter senegalensis TaxID=446692 RepID=UPI00264B5AB9|nr:type IV secretion system DNA-binding domain-containing protein [Acetobacter senegalensis]MDN7350615.1 type IV secretion system DNA-binding domain-containing protein [Acetobacter senegalensis]
MTSDLDQQAHARTLRAIRRAQSGARFRAAFLVTSLGLLVGGGLAAVATTSPEELTVAGQFLLTEAQRPILAISHRDVPITVILDGRRYETGAYELLGSEDVQRRVLALIERTALGGLAGMGLGIGAFALTAGRRRRKRAQELADRTIAGSRVVSETALAAATEDADDPAPLRLGSVTLPRAIETRHLAMIGTTGAGKTTALRQLLDVIEARGEAALVYDTSGDFVAQYYNPVRGDILLNPFDARGAYWNPFDEIRHPADAARIARYLISETGDRDRDVWLETARILVANILRELWEEKRGTPARLLDTLQYMSSADMERWLAHTSSARTFAQDAERATASVLFMLAKAANLLMFLRAEPAQGGESFAFARFFAGFDNHTGRHPWIFVPRKEDHFEAIKPLMALWLECAASSTLGLPPSDRRRMWFLLDEFPDLPRVDNMTRLLPQGRKFGAAVILTFQAIDQMRSRYGEKDAETVLGSCNTKLFLQLADIESRDWASKTIGQAEVEIQTLSANLDPKTRKPQITVGTRREVRPAVMESALRLPPGWAYLLLPDGLPVAPITLTNAHIIARGAAGTPAFEPIGLDQTLWKQTRPDEPKTGKEKKADKPTGEAPASNRPARRNPASKPGPV